MPRLVVRPEMYFDCGHGLHRNQRRCGNVGYAMMKAGREEGRLSEARGRPEQESTIVLRQPVRTEMGFTNARHRVIREERLLEKVQFSVLVCRVKRCSVRAELMFGKSCYAPCSQRPCEHFRLPRMIVGVSVRVMK